LEQYRFYFMGPDGRDPVGPPIIVECKDDQAAVETRSNYSTGSNRGLASNANDRAPRTRSVAAAPTDLFTGSRA
jgi:hypothetical protein